MRRDSHDHYLLSKMLNKEGSNEFLELCKANGATTDLEVKELVQKYRERYPWLYKMWKESKMRPTYRYNYRLGGWLRVS